MLCGCLLSDDLAKKTFIRSHPLQLAIATYHTSISVSPVLKRWRRKNDNVSRIEKAPILVLQCQLN